MLSTAPWMDLKIIILSEVNQTGRQISDDITYIWNLKKNDNMNLFIKNEFIYSQTQKTIYGYQRGKGRRDEFWINKCTLQYIQQIIKKYIKKMGFLLWHGGLRIQLQWLESPAQNSGLKGSRVVTAAVQVATAAWI